MCKKAWLIGCLIGLVSLQLTAQPLTTESYIQQYKDLAIAEMKRTGVPAAIKLAQAILESQSGKSSLALTANNHFGIKCKTEWTGGRTYKDDDEKRECFRVYASVEQSFIDHSDFLKTRPYYASLFTLDPMNMEAWAYGLKKAGYATSSTYPQSLLKVIKDYQLEKYNAEAVGKNYSPNSGSAILPAVIANKEVPAIDKYFDATPPSYSNNSSFPKGVFTINRSKVFYAAAGTILQDISVQFDILPEEIIAFNELPAIDKLNNPYLIFLEKKSKKGNKAFRIAQSGENWRDISQLEGIRLEQLLQYNQVHSPEFPIPVGQKIWLQPGTPNNVSSGTH
jgi:Mannosyl-glycoprotein endo-beta-N-acetylglucosaminidase/LysM domain